MVVFERSILFLFYCSGRAFRIFGRYFLQQHCVCIFLRDLSCRHCTTTNNFYRNNLKVFHEQGWTFWTSTQAYNDVIDSLNPVARLWGNQSFYKSYNWYMITYIVTSYRNFFIKHLKHETTLNYTKWTYVILGVV